MMVDIAVMVATWSDVDLVYQIEFFFVRCLVVCSDSDSKKEAKLRFLAVVTATVVAPLVPLFMVDFVNTTNRRH